MNMTGSTCTIPKSARRSSSFCATSSVAAVKRWLFCSLSHLGWCLLKSPSQNMWSPCDRCTFSMFTVKSHPISSSVLLCIPSLYTLNSVQVSCAPWNWTMMTSLNGKGICSQLLVLNLALTRVTARGVASMVKL